MTSPSAGAHPLGNFTINRYAGIEVAGRDVYVRYALDVAEIPTYQLGAELRKPGYPARLAEKLALTLDGQRVALRRRRPQGRRHDRAPGGSNTLRLDVVYRAVGHGKTLAFDDRSFPDRIGWREVTLGARDGGRIVTADVPERSTSDGLHAYPADLLRSPLDVTLGACDRRSRFGIGSGADHRRYGRTRACGRRFRVAHRAR